MNRKDHGNRPEQAPRIQGRQDSPGDRLAADLVHLRRANGMTQEQLAARLNTKQECIARLESGRALPSLATLWRLAAALNARLEIKLLPDSRPRGDQTPSSPVVEMSSGQAPAASATPASDDDKAAWFRKSAVFSDMEQRYLAQLSRLAMVKDVKAGEFLFRQGEATESCYLLVSGILKVMTHSPSGIDLITAIYGPGEFIGVGAHLFMPEPHRLSGQAIVDTRILSIDNERLAAFLKLNPALRAQVLEKMLMVSGQRRQAAISRLRELASERTDRRLTRILWALSRSLGLSIPLTRREIAEMAGTSTETVARFMSRLAQTGVVRSLRGRVIVVDEGVLRRLAEAG